MFAGAFYYMLGNVSPQFRSKLSYIQLLLLAKYNDVVEFGIDKIFEPIFHDIKQLESVRTASVSKNYIVCITKGEWLPLYH